MSRLIVKGLPKKLTGQQLQEHFSRFGQVTDARLVYTRAGVFRRFGFVGYSTEKQAEEAASYFNHTFLGSSRIQVEIAKPYGDKDIPRPWSKYSKGSSAFRNRESARQQNKPFKEEDQSSSERKKQEEKDEEQIQERQQRLNQDRHKSKLMAMLSEYYELESDPHFAEFLAAHKTEGATPVWANDECREPRSERTRKERTGRAVGGKRRVRPSIVSVQAKRPGGEGILLTRTHLKFEEEEEEEESLGMLVSCAVAQSHFYLLPVLHS